MTRLKKIYKELYPFVVGLILLAPLYWLIYIQADEKIKRNHDTNGRRIEQLWGNVRSVKQDLYVVMFDSLIKYETQILKFDEEGNCTEKQIFDTNGNLASMYLYQNHDLDQTSEIIKKTPEGKMIQKTLFIYDSDDFLVEKLVYNSDWRLCQKNTFNYNSDLEKTKEIQYDSVGTKVMEKNYLYTNGKCTSEILKMESDGSVVEIPCDYQGNPLRIGNFTISYEYDYEHSWIKRSLYSNNELSIIEVRQIEYRDDE
jgi:uncharacterized protein (DUF1499 family)